ncbi:hypothetical protein E0Z10_g10285, partial [Xylaria hypoxylon]
VEFAPPGWGFEEAKETVLQQSSCAFDMALCQTMVCLGYAGTLVILDDTKRRDPDAICQSIISKDVTFTLATPSEYLLWIQHGRDQLIRSHWKGAMCGGEPMTETLCREFTSLRKPELRLINCYGPAETTFGCAANEVSYMHAASVDSGLQPLPNYTIHIVDDNNHTLPVGVPGRIAIGGAGVMTGYLNKDALTAASLSHDHYSSPILKSQGWTSVYLSEDCGRFNTAGRLMIEGRIQGSTQVKIRGIRIELEDIENSIIRYMSPHVRQAVVSHRKGKDGSNADFLVALIVLSDTNPPGDPASFIRHLPLRLPLPQYIRPSLALAIQSLPYTVSGKLDRKAIDALPLPDTQSGDVISEEPLQHNSSDTENILRQLWKDVLPSEVTSRLGIKNHTDFFQVGGSSVALVNLQRRIKDQLGTVLPIRTLFSHTTLGQMAVVIENETEQKDISHPSTIIDFSGETEIPSYISDIIAADEQGAAPRARLQTVALTGATGFLGKEVLRQLVNEAGVRKIHCVAVRSALDQLPDLFDNPKVFVHSGNLRYPRLGLPQPVASEIFADVDVFIHAAAEVSFMKSYHSLKLTNVASTAEAVAMCLPRRIPVHFVSSATISRLSGKNPACPDSARKYLPPDSNMDGYTATKLVAEVFLERVSRQAGLPVMIHRPSSITGEDAPALDLMGNLMKYAQKTSAVPLLDGWSAYLDSISVEAAANELIDHMTSMQGAWSVGSKFQCVHEVGEVETNVHDLQVVLGQRWGQKLEVRPVEEWVNGALQAGMDDLLGAYLLGTLTATPKMAELIVSLYEQEPIGMWWARPTCSKYAHLAAYYEMGGNPDTERLLTEPLEHWCWMILSANFAMSHYGLFMVHDSNSAKVDIVLVHGPRGSVPKSWTKDGVLWPKDLLPKDIPESRVFLFGYDSRITHPDQSSVTKSKIHSDANDLCAKLSGQRWTTRTEDRPIIFIAHSLGGLVAGQVLVHGEQRDESSSVKSITRNLRGMVFLSSSYARPAEIAQNILTLVGFNTQEHTLKLLGVDSERLDELTGAFPEVLNKRRTSKEAHDRIEAFFCYETLQTKSVLDYSAQVPHPFLYTVKLAHPLTSHIAKIIKPESAQLPGCGDVAPIRADHINICKFATDKDEGHDIIVARFRKMMLPPEFEAPKASKLLVTVMYLRFIFDSHHDLPTIMYLPIDFVSLLS